MASHSPTYPHSNVDSLKPGSHALQPGTRFVEAESSAKERQHVMITGLDVVSGEFYPQRWGGSVKHALKTLFWSWSFRCNEAHLKQQTMRGLRIGGLTWKFEMPLSTSLWLTMTNPCMIMYGLFYCEEIMWLPPLPGQVKRLNIPKILCSFLPIGNAKVKWSMPVKIVCPGLPVIIKMTCRCGRPAAALEAGPRGISVVGGASFLLEGLLWRSYVSYVTIVILWHVCW